MRNPSSDNGVTVEKIENLTFGEWKIGHAIGRGAYGVVYSVTGPNGECAAAKICRRDGTDPDRYARELRGARLYQSIPPGDGLVRLLDLRECEWGFYTVMELADDEFGVCPGESSEYRPKTLTHVIAGEKALPLTEALELGITIATGLVTLQRHHLMHRDIKPGNIIYVRGKPVLSDIGLLVEETEAASLVDTPGYVPPENFTGSGSDVYSLGLTLKAASFGRSVEELDLGPTLEADTSDPLFPAWWRILNKATHPDPSLRYHSAKALLKDLKSLHRRKFMSFGSRITSNMSTSNARIGGLVFLILLLLTCGLIIWSKAYESRRDRENARKEAEKVLQEFTHRRGEEEKAEVMRMLDKLKSDLKNTHLDLEKHSQSK